MSHTMYFFGIAAEREQKRLTFFDTQTLAVLHQLTVDFPPLDVTITPNANWAVVSSSDTPILARINLVSEPPVVAGTQTLEGFVQDVDITPNEIFAVAAADRLYSYLVANDLIADALTEGTIALAVSPNGNGLILASNRNDPVVLETFLIDSNGNLSMLGTVPGSFNFFITNIAFSADGNHAFIADFSGVSVLDTSDPNNITKDGDTVSTNDIPFSFAVSRNGTTVYVLTYATVDIFEFNAATGILTLADSFQHGLPFSIIYVGVDYLGLDISETRLFIAGAGTLAAFTVTGQSLGSVAGVSSDAGLALRQSAVARGIKW